MTSRTLSFVVTLALCAGCRSTDALSPAAWPVTDVGTPSGNLTNGCVADYSPGVDYFPAKVSVQEAQSFRVTYHGHYKVIDFVPDVGSQETARYVLVQCGTPVPPGAEGDHVISVPVARFVLAKAEFSSLVATLGLQDRLVGISSIASIADPDIIRRYDQGLIAAVGSGTHSAIELALAVDPDVVFTWYSAFADANMHPKLWDVGISAVPLADHFEPTPLGRSEWMKFFGLFFNEEQHVEEAFTGIAGRYRALAARAVQVSHRPKVLLGWPSTRQQWALNGGRNYMARMVEDAGGTYVWTSDSSRSLDLAHIEQVFDLAAEAEVWVGNQLGHDTLGALAADDPRLALFGPVERRRVFGNDLGRLPSGAFPLANESIGRPDAVLADIIRILHPDLLPAHALTFHHELPQ